MDYSQFREQQHKELCLDESSEYVAKYSERVKKYDFIGERSSLALWSEALFMLYAVADLITMEGENMDTETAELDIYYVCGIIEHIMDKITRRMYEDGFHVNEYGYTSDPVEKCFYYRGEKYKIDPETAIKIVKGTNEKNDCFNREIFNSACVDENPISAEIGLRLAYDCIGHELKRIRAGFDGNKPEPEREAES